MLYLLITRYIYFWDVYTPPFWDIYTPHIYNSRSEQARVICSEQVHISAASLEEAHSVIAIQSEQNEISLAKLTVL